MAVRSATPDVSPRQVRYDRYPGAVAICSGMAVAFAIAALTGQLLGERLSDTYIMSVFSPDVRASLDRANADTESLAQSFLYLFRGIAVFAAVGLVLGFGVAWSTPRRSGLRWFGILAGVLALAALWGRWDYLESLRWR